MAFTEKQILEFKKRFKAVIADKSANPIFQYELLNKQNETIEGILKNSPVTDEQSEELLLIQLSNTLQNFHLLNKMFPKNELGVDFAAIIEKLTNLLNEFNG